MPNNNIEKSETVVETRCKEFEWDGFDAIPSEKCDCCNKLVHTVHKPESANRLSMCVICLRKHLIATHGETLGNKVYDIFTSPHKECDECGISTHTVFDVDGRYVCRKCHYPVLERKFMGDPDKKTGIYHPDVQENARLNARHGLRASSFIIDEYGIDTDGDRKGAIGKIVSMGSYKAMTILKNRKTRQSRMAIDFGMFPLPNLSSGGKYGVTKSYVDDLYMLIESLQPMHNELFERTQHALCLASIHASVDSYKHIK